MKMKINDNFKIKDGVSGLKIEFIKGKTMDRLHIERFAKGYNNRDFWFNKDGSFDGTGSCTENGAVAVVKITLVGGMELYVSFDELPSFKANIANIEKLEGLEMSQKDYHAIPASNQSEMFFDQVLKTKEK